MSKKPFCVEPALSALSVMLPAFAAECRRPQLQGRLNQWAHWARVQGPRIFFLFEGPPIGCGEINFLKLIMLLSLQCFDAVGWAAGRASGL